MKYILAISGGVDSVVLLDRAARDNVFRKLYFNGADWPDDFAVAHLDHGIRLESVKDLELVKTLANQYGVNFYSRSIKLGVSAGEELARAERYKFFDELSKYLDDAKIVTAHHQDDLLETIVMNLVRGTGWRGVAPMSSGIIRPFIDISKADIVSYAIDNGLVWHEDETNFSSQYFRNRVRTLIYSMPVETRQDFIRVYSRQKALRDDIEYEIGNQINTYVSKTNSASVASRYFFIMAPADVAIELLNELTEGKLTYPQLSQVLLFIKAAKPGREIIFKDFSISAGKVSLSIKQI